MHLAKYKPEDKYVAIKMIDLDLFERNQIEELRRELQIMTLSRHPNLLPVYGSFVHGHKLYIVTPFLSAGILIDLFILKAFSCMSIGSCLDLMKTEYSEGMEEMAIATILRQALLGLDYLHRNGHIHRDVKAGNLLMDEDGSVLLADFGVSSSLTEGGERKAQRRTFVGTPCWMAPEVLSPERGYDQKADIWSFGITALELANGEAPYAKFAPLKVLMLTLQHDPPRLDRSKTKHKYSRAFQQMIELCLQKDPTKRPSSEKLLEHPFFRQAKTKAYLARTILENVTPLINRPVRRTSQPTADRKSHISWDFRGISAALLPAADSVSDTCSEPDSSSPSSLLQGETKPMTKGRFTIDVSRDESASPVHSETNSPSRRKFEITRSDGLEGVGRRKSVRFASVSSTSGSDYTRSPSRSRTNSNNEEVVMQLLSECKENLGNIKLDAIEELEAHVQLLLIKNQELRKRLSD